MLRQDLVSLNVNRPVLLQAKGDDRDEAIALSAVSTSSLDNSCVGELAHTFHRIEVGGVNRSRDQGKKGKYGK